MSALEVLQNLGIAGLIITATTWLLLKVFEQMLSKDLETFKSNLERASLTFKIRYEKLHTERVEVIKATYEKLVGTYESMQSLMNSFQSAQDLSQEEKGVQAAKNANDFIRYYDKNIIFLKKA